MLLSRFKIQGHSMEPAFHQGDSIIVSSTLYWFTDPKVGDIVLFKNLKTQKHILKRIIKIENKQYIIKGDNIKDSKEFESIEKKEILGKVIFRISNQ